MVPQKFNVKDGINFIKNKLILIVGGAGGLGKQTAALLSSKKAKLIVVYKENRERAEELYRYILNEYSEKIEILQADISTEAGRNSCVQLIKSYKKPLYSYICFSGKAVRIPFSQIKDEEFTESFIQNTIGPILLARDLYPILRTSVPEGVIIFLSSMQAIAPFSGSIPYALPKYALLWAVKILAKEWSGRGGVRVNAIAPGVNEAGMALESIKKGKYNRYIEKNLIPRYGKPEDIAKAILFLIQPDNYITGQVFTIDGGLTLNIIND